MPTRRHGGEELPAKRQRWFLHAPPPLYRLPHDNCAQCLSFLAPEELMVAELASYALRMVTSKYGLWETWFQRQSGRSAASYAAAAGRPPRSWKMFYFQYRRESHATARDKIPGSACNIAWRVQLPASPQATRLRSGEFPFGVDALVQPIMWQLEVELLAGTPADPSRPGDAPHMPPYCCSAAAQEGKCCADSAASPPRSAAQPGAGQFGELAVAQLPEAAAPGPQVGSPPILLPTVIDAHPPGGAAATPATAVTPSAPSPGGPLGQASACGHFHQSGFVRLWTTNAWTRETTQHYYGSYCTLRVRDVYNRRDLVPEVRVDIDCGAALEFDACPLPRCRELVITGDLTLALEMPVPLAPFYRLISAVNPESDIVKIGYCRALFEIARCKRRSGGGSFVCLGDRSIGPLIDLAGDESTSAVLRAELFQALFNLLGTAWFLGDELIQRLLEVCLDRLGNRPGIPSLEVWHQTHVNLHLAQNIIGSVFNLLAHPLAPKIIRGPRLGYVVGLLNDEDFRLCRFSALVVLLTVQTWGNLPQEAYRMLAGVMFSFMESSDPCNTEHIGVAWDEGDIASFYLPLLRSQHLLPVTFAAWCIQRYYFDSSDTSHYRPQLMQQLDRIA
eukprot:TRINITY_DN10001_c0_g1_i1.p1 TRINITY_DN10001_c0_g1~~TRINITY_DN10001_c0_g1_i1.p1  ORF type:complete len:646 (+),score=179.80 TRINITY_DN10001_c0_g1_i1:85-1938(+)